MVPGRVAARVFAATFVGPLLVVLACPILEKERPFHCRPVSDDPGCDSGDLCCSDDPAALALDDLLELDGPSLPAYGTGSATPLFAADRNATAASGFCIQPGSVPPSWLLANGCPAPCNPTWDPESVASVCGADGSCCQTNELAESDCVLDPGLGESGCWRPARGDDIVDLGGLEATSWSVGEHATHQDPGFHGCEAFVAGLTDTELETAGVTADEVRLACLRRLGVANQRGFCMDRDLAAVSCQFADPSYRDACEQLNDTEGRNGCD